MKVPKMSEETATNIRHDRRRRRLLRQRAERAPRAVKAILGMPEGVEVKNVSARREP